MERRYGTPYMVIHRTDLHDLFLAACRDAGVDLRTSQHVTAYENTSTGSAEPGNAEPAGARVRLADGTSHEARLVVAADGLHSVARRQLVGDEPVNSAFVAYREDPWPAQPSMRRALLLAEQVAAARPDLAPSLFEALSRPFAAGAMEQQRRFTRVTLVGVPGMEGRCREALGGLEPFVPWAEELLRRRVVCYGSEGPLAARARAELEEFRRHKPGPR